MECKNALTIQQETAAVQTVEKTFQDFVEIWLVSDSLIRAGEQTKKSYRQSLKAFASWLAAQGIDRPVKQDIKDWCSYMDSVNLSVATKNLRLTTLRNFYRWLASEYGVANIVDGLKGWRDDKEHRRGYLSFDEMRELMSVIDTSTLRGKRDKAIIGVMLSAGLRTIEISRLHVKDVKEKGGVCYLAVLGKGKHQTVDVKISCKTLEVIRDWLNAREAVSVIDENAPLFCSLSRNSYGEAISTNSVSTLCKKYLEWAGLKTDSIVAHSLRHSMATNALLENVPLTEIQAKLRHQTMNSTMIYIHAANKKEDNISEVIADKIF